MYYPTKLRVFNYNAMVSAQIKKTLDPQTDFHQIIFRPGVSVEIGEKLRN